jgi:AcrR family transcriptional regulator
MPYRVALARGGVSAVAVEPLAAELGVTKGSFYSYFPHRDALVAAADRAVTMYAAYLGVLQLRRTLADDEAGAATPQLLTDLLAMVAAPDPGDDGPRPEPDTTKPAW